MTFHVGVTPELVNWLMYYGSRVSVVKPERPRAQVAGELRKAAERYE